MLHKNKIILFTVILLALGIYGIKYIYFPTNVQQTIIIQNSNDSSLTAHEQLKQKLQDQEQQVWDLLQTNTLVSKEECLEKQKNDYNSYKKSLKADQVYKQTHYPKLKKETMSFVQDILDDFHLDSKDVQIVSFPEQSNSARADDGTISINEKAFTQYSPEARRFIIAHEISHLQTQDDSLSHALYSLANSKKTSLQKRKEALDTFCRFREIRADINALLNGGEKYVTGAFEFFHKLQELNGGDNPGIIHPKTSKRIEVAQNICSKMGWNMEKNYAT